MGRDTLVEMLKKDKVKPFVHGDDGFLIFFPPCNQGAYTAHNLREIADYLDEQNKEWEEKFNKGLDKHT
jgi:hypothetical protein